MRATLAQMAAKADCVFRRSQAAQRNVVAPNAAALIHAPALMRLKPIRAARARTAE